MTYEVISVGIHCSQPDISGFLEIHSELRHPSYKSSFFDIKNRNEDEDRYNLPEEMNERMNEKG